MFVTFAIGNVVRDAELKNVNVENTPTPRCRFTVAVNRTTRSGKNKVTYLECTAWRKYAENIAPYLKKGRQVHVQGEPDINQYTDNNGTIRTNFQLSDVTVTFLGKKPDGASDAIAVEPEVVEVDESDLPF